jgi:hypothetical protein
VSAAITPNLTPEARLENLIEWARLYVIAHPPTPEELEEFRRSFAYGNVSIHNPSITRADVDRVADEMKQENDKRKGTIG